MERIRGGSPEDGSTVRPVSTPVATTSASASTLAPAPATAGVLSVALWSVLAAGACTVLPARPDGPAPLEERSARVATELTRVRDLELLQPVPAGTMDKESLHAYLEKEIEKEWGDDGDLLERAYKTFGLLPRDMDLKPWLADFMKDQVGGFYDTETKRYWTIDDDKDADDPEGDDGKRIAETFVLAHELTHALEDQHFDLEARLEERKQDDDAESALSALVEGSAMDAAADHALGRVGFPLSLAGPVGRWIPRAASWLGPEDVIDLADGPSGVAGDAFAEAPPIIQASLVFPYLQGWHFVNRVRGELGWSGVNRLYRDPPESTEQVIHPERWIDRRDRPVRVVPAPAPAGWTARYDETLGMLGTRVLLAQRLGGEAADAAEGWDGDRYVLWETPTGDAIGWVTVWDRERQAARFEEAYRELLLRNEDPDRCAVARADTVVAAVQGAPAGAAAAAAEALLASEIVRAPDDRAPEGLGKRLLLWPVSLRTLDHGDEGKLLGGLLVHFRTHAGGTKLRLLSSLALHGESSPDRVSIWVLLGLVGFTSDRTLGFDYARIPIVADLHRREDRFDGTRRTHLGLVLDLIRYVRDDQQRKIELVWGLLTVGWGEGTPERGHFGLLSQPLF